MRIYTCDRDWICVLTAIYDAWTSKIGHQNIRIEYEPVEQYSFFNEYYRIEADEEKASKVIDAVIGKISYNFYHNLAYTYMAYETDVPDVIYRMMILGFAYGEAVTGMRQFKEVNRYLEIRKRLGREVNRFQEVVRFHKVGNGYVAHIEPKSRLVVALGPIFSDRMPSENYMIVDDIHHEALIGPADKEFYIMALSEEEMQDIIRTEEANDEFTVMWKKYFDAVAIQERKNDKCQKNMFPVWARKHAVEFA